MSSSYFHSHVHSEFSVLDGMGNVGIIAEKANALGHTAMALTDHGNMAGTVQLYKACRRLGMLPYPGFEGYLVTMPVSVLGEKGANYKRFHIGLLARTEKGYQALVKLSSLSHTRPRFSKFPRITLEDLADLSERAANDVVVLTGCHFGLVQQTLVNEGPERAKNIVEMYAKWFPHTFVEVQHHHIDGEDNEMSDDEKLTEMRHIAHDLGLPMIATQDSHYVDLKQRGAHDLMKKLVYAGSDDSFPGDGFHFSSTRWVQNHYSTKTWARIEEGCAHLQELNEVKITPLDKFKFHVPQNYRDPLAMVRKICLKQMQKLGLTAPRYMNRLEHELDIIEFLKIAAYLMLGRKVVQKCEKEQWCIEARGSANSSLVNFLLGITQIDPIKWNTLFERFLSKDRKKPADIDFDIEDVSRPKLIAWLKTEYNVVQIGTFGQLGIDDEGHGSIMVTYMMGKRRELGDRFPGFAARVKSLDDVRGEAPDDFRSLTQLSRLKARRSYGVHAGGVLLEADSQKIGDWVPTMLVASSDTTVSQFTMDDVEVLGYLKLDILGQRTLTKMRRAQQMAGRENPRDFTWIPDNDKQACQILRSGRADNGIFHFEGYTKAKGGREMGIKSTKDAVLAQALFMPGAMDTGQTDMYLRLRRDPDGTKRALRKLPHDVFRDVLKETYGAVVFQEQVINIMRGLGMTIEDINIFFSVVKDSGKGAIERNQDRLLDVRRNFEGVCEANNIQDVQSAWDKTAGFVAYGFNQAHATGYGVRSYRDAYLCSHYPLEWYTALLETSVGHAKERIYVGEARRAGFRILPPDVNVSGAVWTIDRRSNAIRRGLQTIKGVGYAAAKEIEDAAPFDSLEDLIKRTTPRLVSGGKEYERDGRYSALNGVLGKLRDAGALKSIGVGQDATRINFSDR